MRDERTIKLLRTSWFLDCAILSVSKSQSQSQSYKVVAYALKTKSTLNLKAW